MSKMGDGIFVSVSLILLFSIAAVLGAMTLEKIRDHKEYKKAAASAGCIFGLGILFMIFMLEISLK